MDRLVGAPPVGYTRVQSSSRPFPLSSSASAASPSDRGPASSASLATLGVLASELAAEPFTLEGAAERLRLALDAEHVRVESAGVGAAVESAGREPPVSVTRGAGSSPVMVAERAVDLRIGGRRIAIVRAWFAQTPPEDEMLDRAAQLLAPLVLLEDSRRAMHAELAARSQRQDEQERFISMIVDSLPLGLYVVDREYRIRLWNHGREKGLQGVAREDVLGHSIFEVLHRQPAERLRRELDAVIESGEISEFEAESTAFGEPRSYRLSRIPMRFAGEAVTHVIAIGEDITEWKRAQLRTMRAEKLAAVGQLAAGVMHEVNNPLATIAACAETLKHELTAEAVPDAGTVRELTEIIEHEVHRCRRLVDDLLGFSRQSPAERVPLEIEHVLDETVALLAHHSRFKRARIRREADPEPLPLVLGSREQLMQVFMALLLNAVDATAKGGGIVLRTSCRPEGEAVVEVLDDGSGIPSAEIARIFEPFFTTKPQGQGTGLGLAISYGIVSDHGGRIDVQSVMGEGSTFSVILPAWEGA